VRILLGTSFGYLEDKRPTVCVDIGWGGRGLCSGAEKPEFRIIVEICADSPASGARGVRRF
jgi:hypothetical protein